MRPLPLALEALPAPEDVILLVCMSSPMYLALVRHVEWRNHHKVDSRLEEAISTFELLVLVLHDLHSINDLHEAGLERFSLPGEYG